MRLRTEPLKVTFTLSPDSVRGLFDLVAEAAGSDDGQLDGRRYRRMPLTPVKSFPRQQCLPPFQYVLGKRIYYKGYLSRQVGNAK